MCLISLTTLDKVANVQGGKCPGGKCPPLQKRGQISGVANIQRGKRPVTNYFVPSKYYLIYLLSSLYDQASTSFKMAAYYFVGTK